MNLDVITGNETERADFRRRNTVFLQELANLKRLVAWVFERTHELSTLLHNGITAGCGGGNYCSTSNVTRWQMAVFLVTAFHIPFLHSWPERFTDAH